MSETKKVAFSINSELKEFEVDPDEKLVDVLRRAGYRGVKYGCREGVCGSCTVIMDGRAICACLLYAFQADGRDIWTIEGVGDFDDPHPFQKALVEEGAVQCGFCIPGMVLSAKALLDKNPTPEEWEIREKMDGNLCRCTGYEKIFDALNKVIAAGAKGGKR
jgi:carbon-monoxide dehydrogenase small subunit